jgi:two-component system, sensor histidine kinase and response regulator
LRIRQILFNLIDNAIKFTNEGSVTVNVIHVGPADGAADLVRFEVKDTGIGVAPDAQKRIFEEFQQADTSLARRFGGSGLGLAICTRLIALMSGEIGMKGNDPAGSVFWFSLPLERAGTAKAKAG